MKTDKFFKMLDGALDKDLADIRAEKDVNCEIILLFQILRELKKEGPEEKTSAVKGFTA